MAEASEALAASAEETVKPFGCIKALSSATARQISSSQVLVDPSSVVKELIDNALDARATAIFVDVAANTLDSIQVRDNGHGIPAHDRALVCRRYCTSKMRDFHSLKQVGGKWLGFRGEALASMADLSGSMGVITRVEGESVAVLARYDQRGEVASIERASHPVGTTVKITEIFKNTPVRRQEALKHSPRFLAKIRRLIQSYALARPAVRFHLRVPGAKTDKLDLIYAPKAGANIEDVALKVVGRDCALQCDWSASESNGFEVHALLPKPNAIASKVSNEGTFIAVDARPVASARGIAKKITSSFRAILRKTNHAFANIKDPFLCMNIICPPGSYDPNIEPAKDDVLFETPQIVLDIAERLFKGFYLDTTYNAVDCLTASLPPAKGISSSSSPTPGVHDDQGDHRTSTRLPLSSSDTIVGVGEWTKNMYEMDEERLRLRSRRNLPAVEEEASSRVIAMSNPWTTANMYSPFKLSKITFNTQLAMPANGPGEVATDYRSPMPTRVSKASWSSSPPNSQALSQFNASQQRMLNSELETIVYSAPRPRAKSPSPMISRPDEAALSEASDGAPGLGTIPAVPRHRAQTHLPLNASPDQLALDSSQDTPERTIAEASASAYRRQRKGTSFQNKPFKPPKPAFNATPSGEPTRGRPSRYFGQPVRLGRPKMGNLLPAVSAGNSSKHRREGVLDAEQHCRSHSRSDNDADIREFFGRNVSQQPRPSRMESALGSSASFMTLGASGTERRAHQDNRRRLRRCTEDETAPPERQVVQAAAGRCQLFAPSKDIGFPGQDTLPSRDADQGPSRTRRHSRVGCWRTLSSQLPTETASVGHQTLNIVLSLSVSMDGLTAISHELNMNFNSEAWERASGEAYDSLATPVMGGERVEWARKVDGWLHMIFGREGDASLVVGAIANDIQEKLQGRSREDEDMLPV